MCTRTRLAGPVRAPGRSQAPCGKGQAGEEVSTAGGRGRGLGSQPPALYFSPPLTTMGQMPCAAFPGFCKPALTVS